MVTIRFLVDDLEIVALQVFQNENGVLDRSVEALWKGQRLEVGLQPRLLHLRDEPRVGEALVLESSALEKAR